VSIDDLETLERRMTALQFVASTKGLSPETRLMLANRLAETALAQRRVRDQLDRLGRRHMLLLRRGRGKK
jgi:hypothetical protein